MGSRRLTSVALALALAAGCGGGGGGGVSAGLVLEALAVLTQSPLTDPPFGTTEGGDTIRITGGGFVNGLTVTIAGRDAPVDTVTVNRVTATTPVGLAGTFDVTVRNPDGEEATLDDAFQYVAPPAVVQLMAMTGPTAGENRVPIAGGETVRIAGTGFSDGIEVEVDGQSVAPTVVDDSTAEFVAPARSSEGGADVTVRNDLGLEATSQNGLQYTAEFSLAPAGDVLTSISAQHLFRRAGFGAPAARVADARARGMSATVDGLLDYANDDAVEAAALERYGRKAIPGGGFNVRVNKEWWLDLIANNPNLFQERFAYFLHDHFATSERDMNSNFRWTLHRQIQLFRRFTLPVTGTLADGSPGLGYDWRALLVEIAKDRAMLDWLDGRVSRVGAPNENFARELWELFMLGEGNGYTEADIKEAARAFTGFQWFAVRDDPDNVYLEIRYVPNRHDAGEKTILGETGRFGYDDVAPFHPDGAGVATDARDTDGGVVALTLRRRPVEASRFICRKLVEFLLYDDPHDSVVDELAADLRAPGRSQWNLKPVIAKILKSRAMYSSRAIKGKVKAPVEFMATFLHQTGLALSANRGTAASRMRTTLAEMGQTLLEPPDVNGWPSGPLWLGSQSQLERINFLNLAIQELDDVGEDLDPLLPPRGQRSPTELVDHLSGLLDVQLSGSARTRFIAYVTTQLNDAGETVPFPYDQNNDDHVKPKARDLLWLIAQYHDAHRN